MLNSIQSSPICAHVFVSGQVQGVGYRFSTREQALLNGQGVSRYNLRLNGRGIARQGLEVLNSSSVVK